MNRGQKITLATLSAAALILAGCCIWVGVGDQTSQTGQATPAATVTLAGANTTSTPAGQATPTATPTPTSLGTDPGRRPPAVPNGGPNIDMSGQWDQPSFLVSGKPINQGSNDIEYSTLNQLVADYKNTQGFNPDLPFPGYSINRGLAATTGSAHEHLQDVAGWLENPRGSDKQYYADNEKFGYKKTIGHVHIEECDVSAYDTSVKRLFCRVTYNWQTRKNYNTKPVDQADIISQFVFERDTDSSGSWLVERERESTPTSD